jgi:CDP-diacylglycerol pyrophosphatase
LTPRKSAGQHRGMITQAIRLCCALALLLVAGRAMAGDPDALWKLLHDRCVPDFTAHGDPAPCAEVVLPEDAPSGWVVLKDRDGATQYLLMPTQKITGIEDAAILAPNAPNFWAAAWDARTFLLARVGHALPRAAISLAINSPYGRTQNQLHIHIDCLATDVAATLAAHLNGIGLGWTALPLEGHAYRARRLDGASLEQNPFRLLADDPAVGPAGMGRHTLVLVGETFADGKDGFVLLDDQVDLAAGDRASGEELQDHACAIAR